MTPPCWDTKNPSYSRLWVAVLAHWAASVSSPLGEHSTATSCGHKPVPAGCYFICPQTVSFKKTKQQKTGLFPKSARWGLNASRPLEGASSPPATRFSKRSSGWQRSDAARCRDRAAELFGRLFWHSDKTLLHRQLRDLPRGNLSAVSRRSSMLGAPGYLCQHTEL